MKVTTPTIFILAASFFLVSCGSFEPLVIETRKSPEDKDASTTKHLRSDLEQTAKKLLGTPYRYGGTDRNGFDCSGFTVFTFGQNGIQIPRTASDQYRKGRVVQKISEARRGDLVFFQLNSKIDHVGMVTRANRRELWIIHSTSSKGVMHQDVLASTYWRPRLKGVKDILGD